MKSKKISGTLVRKNLSRYWFLLLLVCIWLLPFISRCVETAFAYEKHVENYTKRIIYQSFEQRWENLMFPVLGGYFEFLLAIIAALCGFSYLHKKKEGHFYHSLPLKKDSLFLSSLLSGFLLYALPWLVATLLSTPLICSGIQGNSFILGLYFQGMIFRLAMFIISYGIAVLAAVLCGRRFFALLLTWLLHILFPLLKAYLYLILENTLLGLSAEIAYFSDILRPFTYLIAEFPIAGDFPFYSLPGRPWGALGIYVGVSLILMVLSAILHRKRKEEHADQGFVFPSLYLWIQYLLTLLIAILIAKILVILDVILSEDSPLAFPCLILTPVAFFLSRMLLLRTIKVFQKKAFLQCGIFFLCFLAVILVFRFDLLGIVSRVP